MGKTYFVNVYEDVYNVSGKRFSKEAAYVSEADHSIGNSLVHSFAFDSKDEAEKVAAEINSGDYR